MVPPVVSPCCFTFSLLKSRDPLILALHLLGFVADTVLTFASTISSSICFLQNFFGFHLHAGRFLNNIAMIPAIYMPKSITSLLIYHKNGPLTLSSNSCTWLSILKSPSLVKWPQTNCDVKLQTTQHFFQYKVSGSNASSSGKFHCSN